MARLLLAERHPTLRLLISTLTTRAGHEIDAVETGEDVLERLNRADYHCLMIGAPILLGRRPKTLLQHIEDEAVEVSPRIVVLTARTLDRELLVRAARLRVCAIVSQPFDNDELLQTIDACARNERPPRRFVGFDQAGLHHVFGGDILADW
ncbi:MAG TPA: hypothetical protein VNA04_13065 [Thermoanaerobaculia bacterium]|nr:hypothetical protein [Thermoanaerobaculia bacterium]